MANMTAGHILLAVIGSSLMSLSISLVLLFALIALGAIYGLEILVGALQCVVFLTLLGVYLNDLPYCFEPEYLKLTFLIVTLI